MRKILNPVFDEIQIRAICPYPHENEICLECDGTEYINRWVSIHDLLHQVTLDNMPVNLQWHPPLINEQ